MIKFLFIFLNSVLLSQTVITVSPTSLTVNNTGAVNIQVLVNNVSNLHSASVTLGFDSTVLRYSGISNGTFLQNNPNGYSVFVGKTFYPNSISPNQVKVDLAILGNASVSGSGLLFSINFTANHAGVSAISINNYVLMDLNSVTIPCTAISGTVTASINLLPKAFFAGSLLTGHP